MVLYARQRHTAYAYDAAAHRAHVVTRAGILEAVDEDRTNGRDIRSLIERAKAREPGAFKALYERYQAPVAGLIRRRLSPQLRRRYDTLDLVQSVFTEVLRDLPRFEYRGEPQLRHWIYIKAETKVWAKFRKDLGREQRRREVGLPTGLDPADTVASPSGDAARREEAAILDERLRALDQEHQELLRLRYEEGLTFRAIATEMDLVSAGAARKRLARCLRKLHDMTTSLD